MLSRRISGTTGTLAPNDATKLLRPEMRPIHVRVVNGPLSGVLQSAWEPTQEELQLIIAGASVIVTTASRDPPATSVTVEAPADPVPDSVTAEKRAALTLATLDVLISTHTIAEAAMMLGKLLGRVTAVSQERGGPNLVSQFVALLVENAQSQVIDIAAQKIKDALKSNGGAKGNT